MNNSNLKHLLILGSIAIISAYKLKIYHTNHNYSKVRQTIAKIVCFTTGASKINTLVAKCLQEIPFTLHQYDL